jgi:hypothetical protein
MQEAVGGVEGDGGADVLAATTLDAVLHGQQRVLLRGLGARLLGLLGDARGDEESEREERPIRDGLGKGISI